ncbi:MAG TPA: DUF4440 domain-containing protein, partial [Gemmatimonas sp.]|nr:DUF4440 domain-containing protein [Gemmatimonas sp.]
LFRVERAFSDSAARDVRAAFAHFVAPDGAKLDSAGYIWGPSAIGTLFQTTPPEIFGFAWHPEAGTVAASGDLGFTIGPVNSRLADGTLAPSRGNYFTIWQRQPNGSWRWLVD